MGITVKICGLTRPQDVEAAIEAGADVLGFVFDRGPCFVSDTQAKELLSVAAQAARPRVCIAVVGELPAAAIARIAGLGFSAVQAVEPAYDAAAHAGADYVVPAFFDSPTLAERVRTFRAAHAPLYSEYQAPLRGCVNVDGSGGGGTGTRADWGVAAELAAEGPLMLAGGLNADNVAGAIAQVRPLAVDVSSGVEASPGVKDPARLFAFVEAAKAAP